jgi:hypothetical protein
MMPRHKMLSTLQMELLVLPVVYKEMIRHISMVLKKIFRLQFSHLPVQ